MKTLTVDHLIENISVPAFIIDPNHKVQFWNHSCEALTGLKIKEMMGSTNHWKGFYPYKRKTLVDILLDGSNEDELNRYYKGNWVNRENSSKTIHVTDFFPELGKEGKWLSFEASLLTNECGDTIGAIETFLDVTEMFLAQRKLSEKEKEMDITFANLLSQIAREKESVKKDISLNIEKILIPLIDHLISENPDLDLELQYFRAELKNISSDFYRKIVALEYNLTPAEIGIVKYVLKGYRNKEIAQCLSISLATVKKHKISIRKKLNISKESISLETCLNNLCLR